MKRIMSLLLLSVSLAFAQGPDQEYIRIYNLIAQADASAGGGEIDSAVRQYREAQDALEKLKKVYPQWNQPLVQFRLNYLAGKLQGYPAVSSVDKVPTPNIASKDSSIDPALDQELARLRAEKNRLEAKLREALSIQPGVASSDDLAKIEARMIALEKERDLLKVTLEHSNASSLQAEKPGDTDEVRRLRRERDELQEKLSSALSKRIDEVQVNRNEELEQLRARLEVLEAKPVPYTPEELALFKQTSPQLANTDSKPKTQSRQLPAGAGAFVAQAERAFASRRFDEAEGKYQEVLRQDENNVFILGNLAATQMEMDKFTEAEKNINRALQVDADDSFSLTLLGMLRFREGKFNEALDVLSRSARINPDNAETQNYLGITLSQKGQRAPAEAALRKAIKLQPNYAGAHHNLAVIYATQKPPFAELARWHYEKGLALGHPKNADLEKLLSRSK